MLHFFYPSSKDSFDTNNYVVLLIIIFLLDISCFHQVRHYQHVGFVDYLYSKELAIDNVVD